LHNPFKKENVKQTVLTYLLSYFVSIQLVINLLLATGVFDRSRITYWYPNPFSGLSFAGPHRLYSTHNRVRSQIFNRPASRCPNPTQRSQGSSYVSGLIGWGQ